LDQRVLHSVSVALRHGSRSLKPVLYVENFDKVVAKAVSLGATAQGTVSDMFWGDRCGNVVDPNGYMWMIGTHKAEPTNETNQKRKCRRDAADAECLK
jgi:PhnB protein